MPGSTRAASGRRIGEHSLPEPRRSLNQRGAASRENIPIQMF